jgi:hypothetical protein
VLQCKGVHCCVHGGCLAVCKESGWKSDISLLMHGGVLLLQMLVGSSWCNSRALWDALLRNNCRGMAAFAGRVVARSAHRVLETL